MPVNVITLRLPTRDATSIAIEYDEFADARLARSIAAAEVAVDALVDRMIAGMDESVAA